MYMKTMRVVAPAAALLLALGFAGSAQAATSSTNVAKAEPSKQAAELVTPPGFNAATAKALGYKEITVPLKVTGFNAAVAKAHGYKIETLANGKQAAVRPGTVASPQDEISGDCGDAFLWFEPQGNKKVDVFTGFYLNEPAIFYYWDVAVTDSAGTGTKLFYGGLADDYSWNENWDTTHSVTGPGSAKVTDGWVTLYTGDDCTALNPSDSGTID